MLGPVMSIDGIKEALHQNPFRPFVLRMISGKEYKVDHPDFIGASRSYRRLYLATAEDDRVDIVDTLMVESMQMATAPNGVGD
ncbi:MAG TPA: hypothetical protein VGM54_19005 [Chthoniobacter sp.]